MPPIDYDHSRNLHTAAGPREAFQEIFAAGLPRSLVDVGCGTGTWMKAALDAGIQDVFGVDGIAVPADTFLVPRSLFVQQDLTQPWDLGRRFDVALCLEVAEHLDESYAGTLLDVLTAHADKIVFSAACPGQRGQHHVNCRWPDWWQRRFNDRGYVCDDSVRWRIWGNHSIEPWYRQNLFVASHSPSSAGSEPRLPAVVHPDLLEDVAWDQVVAKHLRQIENGSQPVSWYLSRTFLAVARKCARATTFGR
jgi:SAM-dependent methyltransferase